MDSNIRRALHDPTRICISGIWPADRLAVETFDTICGVYVADSDICLAGVAIEDLAPILFADWAVVDPEPSEEAVVS